jgi:low affinity Fe/Cu permease
MRRKNDQQGAHRSAQGGLARRLSGSFEKFSATTARLAGRPYVFLAALMLVFCWAAIGPFVGFTDTWQLVINTSTTIITFLMVFLIQHTQNRDTLALQIKVAELLVAMKGADGNLATAEDLSEESLEQLHQRFKQTVQATTPTRRRAGKKSAKPESRDTR